MSAEDKQKSLYDTNFDISMMTDRPEMGNEWKFQKIRYKK